MNLELCASFAEAVFPADAVARENLFENAKLGRFKDFDEAIMQQAVDFYAEGVRSGGVKFPTLFCQDVQAALPTHDKQNFKILAHVAQCECCQQKVS